MAVATPPPAAQDVAPASAPTAPALEFVELADLKPAGRAANPLDSFIDKRVAILSFEATVATDSSAITGGTVRIQEIDGATLTGDPADISVGRRLATALDKRLQLAPDGKIVSATVKREKRSVTLV